MNIVLLFFLVMSASSGILSYVSHLLLMVSKGSIHQELLGQAGFIKVNIFFKDV